MHELEEFNGVVTEVKSSIITEDPFGEPIIKKDGEENQ
jgi:hypothetical protein